MANPVTDIINNLDKTVAYLGSPGIWKRADGSLTQTAKGLISPVDRRDVDLVNAFGANGVRLTFKWDAFSGQRPKKFDSFTSLGNEYIFDTVNDIIVSGELIGFTCYARGLDG
jgi:hypothetical protein